MVTLYYLLHNFGLQYILGFAIIAMTLRVINAVFDTEIKMWQLILIAFVWPILLPVAFIAVVVGADLKKRFGRFNH